MKITTIIICLLGGTISLSANAEDSLGFLKGKWNGPGSLSGSKTVVHQSWEPALNGTFTVLRHQIRVANENGHVLIFEGVGYYRELAENSLSGVWIGSYGNIHRLEATVEPQTLTVRWGNDDGELGQSVYQLLKDGSLSVLEAAKDENESLQVFASAILVRAPIKAVE